ncbi:fibronectin type III domain-containing protein [Streptomyces avicenniae]|uniref:fibronectin type III domain-containing protein n=1 Tax=Streptomyces avicenniae TaxID=500153 RepID=UPI000699CFEB|nr:fibronectin type III domain-containing protein [Streptomyces avicenniae]
MDGPAARRHRHTPAWRTALLGALLLLGSLLQAVPATADAADCDPAARAGLVIDFGTADDPRGGDRPVPALTWSCVSPLTGGTGRGPTGVEMLTRSGHTLRQHTNGLICAIDGYPATGCGEKQPDGAIRYWSYWAHDAARGPGWTYAAAGPGTRRLANGSVDGWRYVETRSADAPVPQPRQAPDWDVLCCEAPPASVPQAPTGVRATAGIASATVTWEPPAGPAPVTTYTVEASPGGARVEVPGDTTTATVPGLTPGTPHTFRVRAVNGAGESAPSAASAPVVPAEPGTTAPAAPDQVRARGGVREATVTWRPPADDGGAAVTSYLVAAEPGGATAESTGTSATVTGLDPADAYTFTVRAVNAAGPSAPSAPSAPVAVTAADPRLVPGRITTLAGTGALDFTGDGGPAADAALANPFGVATDAAGDVYIADTGNQRIRRVDADTGVVTTVAGNGTRGYGGDEGPATDAALRDPNAVAVGPEGDLWIADTGNRRVRRVDADTGVITTALGTGARGDTGDGGPGTEARIGSPGGIAVAPDGTVHVSDSNASRVRALDPATGLVRASAGTGSAGFTGDGGPATDARLSFSAAAALATDAAGGLYVADTGNQRVRHVDAETGTITTVAGDGTAGDGGDGGPATEAQLVAPGGVAVGPDGALYISQTGRVRRVDPATGVITTFAGDGTPGYGGDGLPAPSARIQGGYAVAADASGHLYLAEGQQQRVRRVTGPDDEAPTVRLTAVPAPRGHERDATVEFTVDDPAATTTCALDTGAPTPCASPWRGEDLADGTHTLTVTATDPAGNPGTATATWDVVPATGTDPDAADALAWLTRELQRGDHALDRAGTPDWGLTTDALLALAAADPAGTTAVRTADNLAAHAADYVTLAPEGAPDAVLSGPLAKLTLALAATGRDLHDVDGLDLEAELRALMATTGPDAGRFTDHHPGGPDNSNTFGQSLAVLALARTDDGVPAAAVTDLTERQCPSGGFRLTPGTGAQGETCTGDTDATALAVQALLTVPRTDTLDRVLGRAVGWLLARQDTATGAFGGTGPTRDPNANSTGLIAQTLAATGQTDAAARAADWLRTLQLTEGDDSGALAYNPEAYEDGRRHGLDTAVRDEWRRSTTQAVLGLGLPAFGAIGITDPPPVDPVDPLEPGPEDPGGPDPVTEPAVTATPATVRPGETVTLDGVGFTPGRQVAAGLSGAATAQLPDGTADDRGRVTFTWTVPVGTPPGTVTAGLVDLANGATAWADLTVVTDQAGGGGTPPGGSPGGSLPSTGADPALVLLLATALSALGLLLRHLRNPRRRAAPSAHTP